jgi:DNA mismatch repair ATPase MutS
MHPALDFDVQQQPPGHGEALMQDLELGTLLRTMARDDDFLLLVARQALLSAPQNDIDTILYRQAILRDCLNNPDTTRALYDLATEASDGRKKHSFGVYSRYPRSIVYEASDALRMVMVMLRKLRDIAAAQSSGFAAAGVRTLFTMLQRELSDAYLASMQDHLTQLEFRRGVLLSAALGEGNQGTDYVLHVAPDKSLHWLRRLLGTKPSRYTFRIADRDQAGMRALSEMRDRGIHLVANALAQSTEHILGFFAMLRTELAFYVGCLNLHETLTAMGAPTCVPQPATANTRTLHFSGLQDVCLALTLQRRVVSNTVAADGKHLVIITGANQGGKSSFLRSVGVAQLMMQCGMFVAAESFAAECCAGLFTHYKREEDATMRSGKLDEELGRMSAIVDGIVPNAMLLCNESFASTNEREGAEIARQVVSALIARSIKVLFVTHLYDFAHSFFDAGTQDAMFLRAERRSDGTRTFKLVEGEPLETSYGRDLYREVFGGGPVARGGS